MELLAETLYGPHIGGYTTNHTWVDINLRRLGKSLDELARLGQANQFPLFVFPAGGYVVVVQGKNGFDQAQMAFIYFGLDAEDYYTHFSSFFSPKTYMAIFDTQQKIKLRGEDYQASVALTDEF